MSEAELSRDLTWPGKCREKPEARGPFRVEHNFFQVFTRTAHSLTHSANFKIFSLQGYIDMIAPTYNDSTPILILIISLSLIA